MCIRDSIIPTKEMQKVISLSLILILIGCATKSETGNDSIIVLTEEKEWVGYYERGGQEYMRWILELKSNGEFLYEHDVTPIVSRIRGHYEINSDTLKLNPVSLVIINMNTFNPKNYVIDSTAFY